MSYILDALKQSEGRRKQEAPTDPSPAPAFAARRATRRPGRLPLAVVLLVSLAVLGWWGLDSTARAPLTAVPSVKPQGGAAVEGQNTRVSDGVTEFPGAGSGVVPSEVAEGIVAAIGNDALKGVRIQLDDPPPVRTVAPPVRSSADNDRQVDTSRRADQNSAAATDRSEANRDPYAGVPYLRQLPVDVQRSLPDLTFSVHIYSKDPASRRVKIGERMMIEGQRITPQVRLEEIIPKGVILSYQEHRFRMSAL